MSMYNRDRVVIGNPSSCSMLCIQTISLPASQAAIYSASVVDRALYNRLILGHPGNDASTYLDNVGTSGTTSVLATSMVGIQIGPKELGHQWIWEIGNGIVHSALDVLE